jgi:DNA-directed RNA polymerase subunit RPC12/RpoP
MQQFICPECGHESSFDPWVESAHCPQCGFRPPTGMRLSDQQPKRRTEHQPFLDELLSHWNGTHTPDSAFTLPTPESALAFFEDYQQAMGKGTDAYQPTQEEILGFVGAYLWLRRGNRAEAAQRLRTLTSLFPKFTDPWIWLAATADEPAQRIDYLENALVLEPEHPLAQDALVAARGGR